jgi:hypothetical protein
VHIFLKLKFYLFLKNLKCSHPLHHIPKNHLNSISSRSLYLFLLSADFPILINIRMTIELNSINNPRSNLQIPLIYSRFVCKGKEKKYFSNHKIPRKIYFSFHSEMLVIDIAENESKIDVTS